MFRGERNQIECHTDSEYGDEDVIDYFANNNSCSHQPPSLMSSTPQSVALTGGPSVRGINYMVLRTSCQDDSNNTGENENTDAKSTPSVSSILDSLSDSDSLLHQGSLYLLQFLSCSQRLFWFFLVALAIFYFFPLTCILLFATMTLILIGGHQNGEGHLNTRTAKWTVAGFSYQMKDGFLPSPPFLDKCGQWRMVIKQKRAMDGLQTSFGLLCTDISPDIEQVNATITFFVTNLLGQEVVTGGMRNLRYQYEYECPGDCGYSRSVRLPKKLLGQSETITVHCTIEFRKKMVTFLKVFARSLGAASRGATAEEMDGAHSRGASQRKGTNIVLEHGVVSPGNLEFHQDSFPPEFRSIMRFVRNTDTKTFVWEIPDFCNLLENSEVWGVYSPQFFVNSHDFCAIWRMKLIEVQGVFRLHVQLRGLPQAVKQVKLWYFIQLVDMYGDSVIPEHAGCRVKYPDHLNLWDTTRHILYRRETLLERFIGGNNNGALTIRISMQVQPNDVSLMEVDSDNWINRSLTSPGCNETTTESVIPAGLLKESVAITNHQKMLTN